MARLNALFPSSVILCGPDDFDIAPYSVGLRDSIRFSVFEHLMSDDMASAAQQRSIHMKLFCWCDMPGYNQAREAMMRYYEEAKKLEDTCLEALAAIERRCSVSAGSDNPGPAPPVPNPLLRGMPGRELSASSTDTAAIAGDVDAPPVLAYPNDLSGTHFHQHPLAKELGWSSRAKAQLGLIVPSQLASRDFYPGRAPRPVRRAAHARTSITDDTPPVPPLPPIPESLRSNLTPKGLGKILDRMRHRSGSPPPEGAPSAPGPRKPSLKTHISNPELQSAGNRHAMLVAAAPSSSPPPPEPSSYTGRTSSRASSPESPSLDVIQVAGPAQTFRLAEPRLSPMEYSRLYYIEKAHAEREGRRCNLPAPEKLWRWSPHHENFLIIPRVPKTISRDLSVIEDAAAEASSPLPDDTVTTPCPRLSLNLGGMTTLFPSLMNLARLGMSAGPDPPSPPPSPPGEGRPRRPSRSLAVCHRASLMSIAEETNYDETTMARRDGSPSSVTGTVIAHGSEQIEASSLYSDRSGTVRANTQEQRNMAATPPVSHTRGQSSEVSTPSRARVLSSASERPVVEYSPASIVSLYGASSPSPDEDSRRSRPRTIDARRSSKNVPAPGSLDFDFDSDMADLLPAPLQVQGSTSMSQRRQGIARLSRLWQSLSDEIGEKLAEFSNSDNTGLDDDRLLERSALVDRTPVSATTKVRRFSLTDNRHGNSVTKRQQPILQRASSTNFILASEPFITGSNESSGFTPRNSRSVNSQATSSDAPNDALPMALPDSPTLPAMDMPNIRKEPWDRASASSSRGIPTFPQHPPRGRSFGQSSLPVGRGFARGSYGGRSSGGSFGGGPLTQWPTLSSAGPRHQHEALLPTSKISSFNLDRTRAQDAVTILPKFPADNNRGRSLSHGNAQPRSFFDHSPDRGLMRHVDRAKALFTSSSPLGLLHRNTPPSTPQGEAEEPDSGRKSSTSSTFGNFFRRKNRPRSDGDGHHAATPSDRGRPVPRVRTFGSTDSRSLASKTSWSSRGWGGRDSRSSHRKQMSGSSKSVGGKEYAGTEFGHPRESNERSPMGMLPPPACPFPLPPAPWTWGEPRVPTPKAPRDDE
ncbi:hypothetical protein XA68_13057 [Ophiocordyceps unilateralis]|uniref:Uncharacterized protein n=1 Tax=Ophiocordyceps unilateralis TaxID=268505 RepID=A0A2A9PCA0_OPHUN|nr:hypothetical protein XA68_13057 [Ophiocordyceps unilateralis]